MIDSTSPILPVKVSQPPISPRKHSAIKKLAEEIICMEKERPSIELNQLVTTLSNYEKLEDLNSLKLFLVHLDQVEGGKDLIPALTQAISINEEGQSNIESLKIPLLNFINQENIQQIVELVKKDPQNLMKWLRFSIAGSRLKLNDVPIELLNKFLSSKIVRLHFVDLNPISIKKDCVEFFLNEGRLTFKYLDSLFAILSDKELMELVVDFTLKYPKSSVPILLWIRANTAITKQLLLKALNSPEKEEILSKVSILKSTLFLPVLNTLFDHPSLTERNLKLLNQFLDRYPANAQVGAALLLYALENPKLADQIELFLSSANNAKELDFLSNFINDRGVFSEKDPFFTSFFDLKEKDLSLDMSQMGWYTADSFVQLVKNINDLSPEKFELLKTVVNSGKVEFFYWAVCVGLLEGYEIDLKDMKSVFDWFASHPKEYRMFVRICNAIPYPQELFEYKKLGILIWMFIKHFPEDFSTLLNFSEGNTTIALGYINAAMKQLKFDELDELITYLKLNQEKPENKSNLADFNNFYSHFSKLKNLPPSEKRKLNELMFCEKEELANNLMKLFYNDYELATSLLNIVIDHNQKKIVEEILTRIQTQPNSLFINTLKKLVHDPRAILDLYSLQVLIEKTADSQSYIQIMENILDNPSKENIDILFHTLRNFKEAVNFEFQEKDLASITKLIDGWNSNSFSTLSVLLTEFIYLLSSNIIEDNGEINYKVIDQVIHLIQERDLHLGVDYLNHIKFVLKEFKQNQDLIDSFNSISVENDIPPSSALMIRASQRMGYDQLITTANLRRTILTALLTHERQPPDVGSCVGASRLSYMLKHPEKCIKFFSEMLLKGGIFMDLSEKKQVFIRCQPKPSDLFLQKSLTFNKDEKGKPISPNPSPAIDRLAKYLSLNMNQVKDWMQKALEEGEFTNTNVESSRFLSISRRELIRALINATDTSKLQIDPNHLMDIAEVVYLSVIENLPCRSLEGLFVSADATQTANLRWAILAPIKTLNREKSSSNINKRMQIFEAQCELGEASPCGIPKDLQSLWQALFKNGSAEFSDFLLKELKVQIGNHFDLVYDPSAIDFLGNRSCRVVADATSPIVGRPVSIHTPDLFIALASKASQKAFENFEKYLETKNLPNEFKEKWENLKQELSSYLKSERYAKGVSVLFSYMSDELSETKDTNKMGSYDPFAEDKAILGKMPWLLSGGANNTSSWNLVSSKGKNQGLWQVNVNCKEPKDIFNLIENLRGIHNINIPSCQHYAGTIPRHAINFNFSHPALKEFIESEDMNEWLQMNCIAPSEKVAKETLINEKDFKTLSAKIKEKLPPPLRKKWKELTSSYPIHEKPTISEVRNFLNNQLKFCLGTEKEAIPEAFNELDIGLIQLIPEEARKKVPMLPIIDTNWVDTNTIQDIYFALYFSPASGKWELWKVDYLLQNLKKASNQDWFSDKSFYQAMFVS